MHNFYTNNTDGMNSDILGVIPIITTTNLYSSDKLTQDTYEVFVNGDKVGNKTLLTQSEDAQDLQSYLESNGFNGFEYKVEGSHIEIQVDDSSGHMKDILSSYLENR